MRLTGELVALRDEAEDGDSEDLLRWLNMEEWAYFDHPDRPFEPVTREVFEDRLKSRRSHKLGSAGSVWQRFQIDSADGRHIGWVNCYELDEDEGSTRVGICLPEEADWGKGLGTQTLILLLRYLFADRGMQEVRLNTWTGNSRMIRCALKAGFREVSRCPHRAAVSIRGEPLERIDLAVSRFQWEAPGRNQRGEAAASSLRFRAKAAHIPDSGEWLEVKKGARLEFERKPTEYEGWVRCTSRYGLSAWVPESWLRVEGETCVILRDYVSREIGLEAGEEVTSRLSESGWAWVRTAKGNEGWVPLDCLERIVQS